MIGADLPRPAAARRDAFARFWRKVRRRGDHWLWTASTDRDGYGKFKTRVRTVAAHIFAFEQLERPVAPGLEIDHTCNVRRCVRHLEEVTRAENLRRRDQRRRS